VALDKIPVTAVEPGDKVVVAPGRTERVIDLERHDPRATVTIRFASGDEFPYAFDGFVTVDQDRKRFVVDDPAVATATQDTSKFTDSRGTEWIVEDVRPQPGPPWIVIAHRPEDS
jgi:hypothetical protein